MGLQGLHQPLKLGMQRGNFHCLGLGDVRHFIHRRLLDGHRRLVLDGFRRAPETEGDNDAAVKAGDKAVGIGNIRKAGFVQKVLFIRVQHSLIAAGPGGL